METVKNFSKAVVPPIEDLPDCQIVFWHRDRVAEVTREAGTERLDELLELVGQLSLLSAPGWVQPGDGSVLDVHDVTKGTVVPCGHAQVCGHKANGLARVNKVLDIFAIHINSD